MIVQTKNHLLFDSSNHQCKLIIANDRATVVCLDTRRNKAIKNEYWIPLTGPEYDHRNFTAIVERTGLEDAIEKIMNYGEKSNDY